MNNADKQGNDLISKVAQFKNKYFSDNFYWVDQTNYLPLQNIGIELGCLNLLGEPFAIGWVEGTKNIAFRTYDRFNGITRFQREAFLLGGKEPTNYEEMLAEYELLKQLETK